VVEAALRSGSLITARFAAEQGREVFAVPGSPLDPRSGGTNRLLRDGATLISSAADVIEIIKPMVGRPINVNEEMMREEDESIGEHVASGRERDQIMELLAPSPIEIDDLIRESGLKPEIVVAVLLELELAGFVKRHRRNQVSLA
jgi:DNA processing protein